MPTYEYVCTECGNRVEIVRSMNDVDAGSVMCEICGGALRRVFSPAGIMFKGSGFYATDSRKGKAPKIEGTTSELIDKGKKEAEKRGTDLGGTKDKKDSKDKPSGGDTSDKPAAKPSSPPAKSAKEKSA